MGNLILLQEKQDGREGEMKKSGQQGMLSFEKQWRINNVELQKSAVQ